MPLTPKNRNKKTFNKTGEPAKWDDEPQFEEPEFEVSKEEIRQSTVYQKSNENYEVCLQLCLEGGWVWIALCVMGFDGTAMFYSQKLEGEAATAFLMKEIVRFKNISAQYVSTYNAYMVSILRCHCGLGTMGGRGSFAGMFVCVLHSPQR